MSNRLLTTIAAGALAVALSSTAFAAERQVGQYSPFPEKTEELGNIMQMVFKTLNHSSRAYEHEINDALVKMTLGHIQFAKDNGLVEEVVEDEIRTQSPMLLRVAKMIEKSGDKELALKAVFEQTTCHFQLVLDTEMQPGVRRYVFPFSRVLEQTTRLGQHDLTEEEIYNVWLKPRYEKYGEVLGVPLEVDPWDPETKIITVRIKDFEQVSMR
jgi:hypothetical protein